MGRSRSFSDGQLISAICDCIDDGGQWSSVRVIADTLSGIMGTRVNAGTVRHHILRLQSQGVITESDHPRGRNRMLRLDQVLAAIEEVAIPGDPYRPRLSDIQEALARNGHKLSTSGVYSYLLRLDAAGIPLLPTAPPGRRVGDKVPIVLDGQEYLLAPEDSCVKYYNTLVRLSEEADRPVTLREIAAANGVTHQAVSLAFSKAGFNRKVRSVSALRTIRADRITASHDWVHAYTQRIGVPPTRPEVSENVSEFRVGDFALLYERLGHKLPTPIQQCAMLLLAKKASWTELSKVCANVTTMKYALEAKGLRPWPPRANQGRQR